MMGAKIYKPNIFGKATTKINASEKSNTELKLIVHPSATNTQKKILKIISLLLDSPNK